jgi:hypothetical protein
MSYPCQRKDTGSQVNRPVEGDSRLWNLAKVPKKVEGLWVPAGFRQFAGWHRIFIEYPSYRFCHIL